MTKLKHLVPVLALLYVLLGNVAAATEVTAGPDSFKAQARGILERDLPSEESALAYRALYDRHYSRARQDELGRHADAAQARAWFEATRSVFFYTLDRDYLSDSADALARLASLGEVNAADHYAYYRLLLAARAFDKARDFSKRHAGMGEAPLPATVALAGPEPRVTEWRVDDDGGTLRQRAYDLPMGTAILAVSSPACHFSQRAFAAIMRDPELTAEILPLLKLMTPPEPHLDIDGIRAWNEAKPALRTSLMHDIKEWPMLSDWSTPTFYFFQDGKLITHVTGWPKTGNKEALRAALRQVASRRAAGPD